MRVVPLNLLNLLNGRLRRLVTDDGLLGVANRNLVALARCGLLTDRWLLPARSGRIVERDGLTQYPRFLTV